MSKPSTAGHTSKHPPINLAITGTAGFLGSTLLKEIEKNGHIRSCLALDKKPPPFEIRKTKWIKTDLTQRGEEQKLAEIFKKHRINTLVHTALLTQPLRDLEAAHEIQSVGTMQLLTASAATQVPKLILASTTDVYGATPENPNFLTEDHPLHGDTLSPFLKDKVDVEKQFLKFETEHSDSRITILRLATILGPTVNNFKTHFLQNPLIPVVMGFDPLVQFVHESDCLRAFLKVIQEDQPGIFNIVAKGVLPFSRAIRILNKIPVPIPSFLLYSAAETLWMMNIGSVPGAHINFLKYLCVADGTRAWKKMQFKPIYTSLEALLSFNGKNLKKEMMAGKLEELENKHP